PICEVRLSQLFRAPERTLIMYQMMYGKKQTKPCPMCTSWVDCFNGIVKHVEQRADCVVLMAADVPTIRAYARRRGWGNVRFVSAGASTFKFDLGSESADGGQDSTISVFTLKGGKPRLFYNGHPRLSEEQKERGIDLLNPIWNFFDMTPEGRGDFVAKVE